MSSEFDTCLFSHEFKLLFSSVYKKDKGHSLGLILNSELDSCWNLLTTQYLHYISSIIVFLWVLHIFMGNLSYCHNDGFIAPYAVENFMCKVILNA